MKRYNIIVYQKEYSNEDVWLKIDNASWFSWDNNVIEIIKKKQRWVIPFSSIDYICIEEVELTKNEEKEE